MVLRLLPDVEALVSEYLLAHASVSAQVGTRVKNELPAAAVGSESFFPCITFALVDADEVVRQHFDGALVQVMAWGNTKASASLTMRTARAALLEMPDADHDRGVVTSVRTLVGPRWFPDGTVAPPKPRYHADFRIHVHPHLL